MLKLLVILIFVVVAAILILARLAPATFRVERSTTIHAPPEKVFPYINDLRSWAQWSVWDRIDPNMRKTFSANSSGQGASYEWEGNKNIGHGRMTIIQSVAPLLVVLDLFCLAPIKARNKAELSLQARNGGTRVTWTMYGQSRLVFKLINIFINLEKMIGKNFEDSLASLKTLAEK